MEVFLRARTDTETNGLHESHKLDLKCRTSLFLTFDDGTRKPTKRKSVKSLMSRVVTENEASTESNLTLRNYYFVSSLDTCSSVDSRLKRSCNYY